MKDLQISAFSNRDESEFIELVTSYIGRHYDDIDESFAKSILRSYDNGFDPYGYFTKCKNILTVKNDDETLGYLVATEKRGGSVKVAPLIVKPDYHRNGIASELISYTEELYRDMGFRKLYTHFPIYRNDLVGLFIGQSGFKREAYLRKQYSENNELVVGKIINCDSCNLENIRTFKGKGKSGEIREYEKDDKGFLSNFVINRMSNFYDGIDESFVNSIDSAVSRNGSFEAKSKRVFILEDNDDIIGCCISTPKRGGAIKLSPFLVDHENVSYRQSRKFLSYLEGMFRQEGYRKLYTLVPVNDIGSIRVFDNAKFDSEGIIKQPYKSGIDNLFLGKLLR